MGNWRNAAGRQNRKADFGSDSAAGIRKHETESEPCAWISILPFKATLNKWRKRHGPCPLADRGALPAAAIGIDCALEYGTDRLELHADAFDSGSRVLLVDDVLATGGTLSAAVSLLEKNGADIVGAALVVELATLGARSCWNHAIPLHAVVTL